MLLHYDARFLLSDLEQDIVIALGEYKMYYTIESSLKLYGTVELFGIEIPNQESFTNTLIYCGDCVKGKWNDAETNHLTITNGLINWYRKDLVCDCCGKIIQPEYEE